MHSQYILWSEIDHIVLTHHKATPRQLTIHLKDGKERKYNLRFFTNREVLVSSLDQIAEKKGFTFTSDIPVIRKEKPLDALRTVEYRGKVIPDMRFLPRVKVVFYGILAVAFLVISYFLLSVWTTIFIVMVLVVHECGHIVASRLVGLRLALSSRLPFIGVGTWTNPFSSPEAEAVAALAGPVACLSIYEIVALISPEWGLIPGNEVRGVYWWMLFRGLPITFIINVVDLLPIFPLNGGKILKAILLKTRRNALVVTGIVFAPCVILFLPMGSLFFLVATIAGFFSLVISYSLYVNWKRFCGPGLEMDRPVWWKSISIFIGWISVMGVYWVSLPEIVRFLLQVDYGVPFPFP
jgi:Zn-dependent protease